MSHQARHFAYRALILKNTLGTRCAAGFLRNRNVSLEEALFILTGKGGR